MSFHPRFSFPLLLNVFDKNILLEIYAKILCSNLIILILGQYEAPKSYLTRDLN
jgi:hypothetical protein